MTEQEIFDKVRTHMLAQNAQCTDGGVMCQYRGSGGTMCAVGCLIDDDQYTPTLEGTDVYNPKVLAALRRSGVVVPEGFLADLQDIHDGREPQHWKRALGKLATDYGLTCTDIPAA